MYSLIKELHYNDGAPPRRRMPVFLPLVACMVLLCGLFDLDDCFQVPNTVRTASIAPRTITHTDHPPVATPAILHQVLPPDASKYQAWIRTWDAANLTRITYGDDDLRGIIESLGSQRILEGWTRMNRTIEKVDFVRYALLYLKGGVYSDADQQLLDVNALDRVIGWDLVVLPVEQGGSFGAHQVGQALMVSPPGQPFWWDLMEFMIEQYNSSCNVLINTGPLGVTSFWNQHGMNYPNVRLSRLLDGRYDATLFNQSATLHHMGGSWINIETHKAQLVACKDRVPWTCEHCDERLYE